MKTANGACTVLTSPVQSVQTVQTVPSAARRLGLLGAALFGFGLGCSGSPPGGDPSMQDPMQMDPMGAADMALPPLATDAIRLQLGEVMLQAGEERTVCVTRRLALPAGVDINKINTRQKSSHHVIFYKHTQGTPTINDTPKDCQPLNVFGLGMFKVPLFIGESADDRQNEIQLPPNVAYHFDATDFYTIEAHLFNPSPNAVKATAEAILTPVPAGSPTPTYADMLFFSNAKALAKSYDGKSGGLPPMQKTVIDPAFFTISESFKLFGISTHQHLRGIGVTVTKSTSATDAGTELFTNIDWSHPETYRLPDDQPLMFKKGEGLRWVCSYDNKGSKYVRFGQSAEDDEMCIIWAYYYPSQGFKVYWN